MASGGGGGYELGERAEDEIKVRARASQPKFSILRFLDVAGGNDTAAVCPRARCANTDTSPCTFARCFV